MLSIKKLLKHAKTIQEKIDILNAKSWDLRATDTGSSHSLAHQAADLILKHQIDYPRGIADNVLNLAFLNQHKANYELAILQAEQAIKLYEELNDPHGFMRVYYTLSITYYRMADYSQSADYAIRLNNLAEEHGDLHYHALALRQIGSVHFAAKEYQDALNSCNQSLTIARRIGNQAIEIKIQLGLASTYIHLKDYATALHHGSLALELSKLAGNDHDTAIILGVMGYAYLYQGEYNEALSFHQQKLELCDKLDSDFLRAYTLGDIGTVLLHDEKYASALEWLERGIAIAEQLQIKEALFQNYEAITKVYKALGNYKEALYYFELYHKTKESIFNETEDRNRQNILILHQTQKVKAELMAQQQLRDQERLHYIQLSQLKDSYVANATHDLKNPLSSIMLNCHFLRRTVGNESILISKIETIENSAQRMKMLVTDMLDLARLETGRALDLADASIIPLIEGCLEEQYLAASQKKLQVIFEPPSQDIILKMDSSKIRRVFDNLMGNAIRYSPENTEIAIILELIPTLLIIQVKDHGRGITDDILEAIFEPFSRGERDGQNDEGTGLGLTICKSIVEQHGGTLTVSSEIGKGSVFSIQLPLNTPFNIKGD